jgi:hypothetical protein
MVGIIYYGGLLVFLGAIMVSHGIKAGWPNHGDKPAHHEVAYFDVDKHCKTVYIDSPISYYEYSLDSSKVKSGETCLIGVLTYNVHVENAAPPPSTLDTSQSVPGVLEIPSNGTSK